jgi:dipeptidyl aminopeptidase/acylaminoacyl peptidase
MTGRAAPRWERRFRAPELSLPDWGPSAPQRIVYTSTESGVWQVHARDLAEGTHRQVTDHPVGVVEGVRGLEGGHVIWWQDETGDESGRWRVQPFDGGDTHDLLADVPTGWNQGLAQAQGIVAAAISDRSGFAVYASLGGVVHRIHRGNEFAGVSRNGLSADGQLLAVSHSDHGDLLHPAVRVVGPQSGDAVAEQHDPGKSIEVVGWSPVAGDERLAVVHERPGDDAPAVWDVRTDEWREVETGLSGPVRALDWWPDGSALLLRHEHEATHRLYRYELASAALTPLGHPQGTVAAARVRPDGSVWLVHSSGATPSTLLDDRGDAVLELGGEPAPAGRPYRSFRFGNGRGQSVHGFCVTPEGDGPWPILVRPHGGPTWLDEDRFSPEVQSYVDAGLAVALINYRGSTGYGAAWRDALVGDIGGPELEDLNAGLAHLAEIGVADLERAAVGGWSWGGYLTLMELGKHPELWRCGVAGVPVGDYALGYEDLSPELQAYDRALLGGRPKDVPELMRDRSPINFADQVRAPVLFLIGESDSRCPLRQAMAYVERLRARSHPHQLYLFPTGHGSFDVEEEIRQQRIILEFLAKHVPGVTVPVA